MTRFNLEIKSVYKNLTKTEKKVAEYVLSSPKSVLYQSITELADVCGVGETSVYRFCRSIGLKGYQEFKMRLSLSLNDDITEKNTLASNSDVSEYSKIIAHRYTVSLEQTISLLDEDKALELVKKIEQSKNVYFFGVGYSGVSALDALNKFIRITEKVRYISDVHMQVMISNIMSKDDLIIFISYSGETEENINIAKNAKIAGATVASITRYEDSSIASISDLYLISGAYDNPILDIRISQMYVIDLLYQMYYQRNIEEAKKASTKTNNAIINQLY